MLLPISLSTTRTTRPVLSLQTTKFARHPILRQTHRERSPLSLETRRDIYQRRTEHPTPEASPKDIPITTTSRSLSVLRDVGTIWLCFINLAIFVLSHLRGGEWIPSLYFYHSGPKWWQFITSSFCHANWEHLSSNLFLLYVFGKLVEEQEGAFGVWATYLLCAVGGNLASLWFSPSSSVGLGASAAVFGLFAVSVLIRLRWNWMKLLEAGILGQFVVQQVVNEVNLQMKGGALTSVGRVGHLAHLGGALMGVLLIMLLQRLPDPNDKPSTTASKKR